MIATGTSNETNEGIIVSNMIFPAVMLPFIQA
jgi:hypothetical protein